MLGRVQSVALLPLYRPEFNPAGRVWRYLRERFVPLRVLDDTEVLNGVPRLFGYDRWYHAGITRGSTWVW